VAIHVGTSGWSYDHWESVLYPEGTPLGERLAHYVKRFDTVEVNSTFYHWPRDATFAGWCRQLPEGFWMSVKAPRGLTHGKRLYEPEEWLKRIAGALRRLETRLGALLVQLPPQLEYDHPRLAYFLKQLPRWFRVAVEFRHPSWHREEVFNLLEAHGAAYCIMSGAGLPCVLRLTAPFAYLRLHGPDHHTLYAGSYSDADLHWWAERIREFAGMGREVFAYFNNDQYGFAVRNATTLRAILKI
jgi:uncharacterized protein YecE (DUF72 family)